MDPASAISLANKVLGTIEFLVRVAKRETVERRKLLEAINALGLQLKQAKDSLSVVQHALLPFMQTDSVAGQAAAQMAVKVGMNERVRQLHDHIASLQELFEQEQLHADDMKRADLILYRVHFFALEHTIDPVEKGRSTLVHLVKLLDLGMLSVRDSYNRLHDRVIHSPIAFTNSLDSAVTYLEKGFYDSPFCLQFRATGHLEGQLLQLISTQSALPRIEEILTRCGQTWVDRQLAAAQGPDVDALESVEVCHQNLVSDLHCALQKWQTSFPHLDKLVKEEALDTGKKLMEWFSVSRRRYRALTLAIGGRVSEGKSSLLNAILGKNILPTDRIVETAVPCCIRHAKGQETPALELPYKTPYEHALEQLRKLQQRQHHSEKQQEQLGYLDTKKCKDIASKLLDTSYTIPDKVEGEESIRELLAILNVLTRFSIITEDEIDVGTPDQWPLLTAEFRGLMAFTKSAAKLRNSVCFQFLDCPGYNEDDDHSDESGRFKQLMRRAAQSADAVVPVVSLVTLSSGEPDAGGFFRKEWTEHISAVVVTKLQNKVVDVRTKEALSQATWGLKDHSEHVLCCDSLLGLGGLRLRNHLSGGKDVDIPKKFGDSSDPTSKIYLSEGLRTALGSIPRAKWESIAEDNLERSRIESTFDLLTTYSIRRAQNDRLQLFDRLVPPQMRGLLGSLRCQMTGERAERKNQERSEAAVAEARRVLQIALQSWDRDEETMKSRAAYQVRVQERLKTMEMKIQSSANDIKDKVVQQMAFRIQKWNNQEEARMFFQKIIGEAEICMKINEATTKENVEELATLCRTELLDLLQKVVGKQRENNQVLQAIINAKIDSLQDEIRTQIEKSESNEGKKKADSMTSITEQLAKAFTFMKKRKAPKTKGIVSHSRGSSFKESRPSTPTTSTPSSASPNWSMLLGSRSEPRTPAPSLYRTTSEMTTETTSSQQPFLAVPGREHATAINEVTTSRLEGVIEGGSVTLGAPTEEAGDELNFQDICASSKNLNTYISTNVIDPFLQTVRSNMNHLADIHHIEKVYENMILGVMAEFESAITKPGDQRQRAVEDQQDQSTLAHFQLWANITAAFAAIGALTKAREDSLPKHAAFGLPVFSPLSL